MGIREIIKIIINGECVERASIIEFAYSSAGLVDAQFEDSGIFFETDEVWYWEEDDKSPQHKVHYYIDEKGGA